MGKRLKNVEFSGEVKAYKVGEKEYKSARELVLALLGSTDEKKKLYTEAGTTTGKAAEGDDLNAKAKKFMEQNKGVSYRDALLEVAPQNEGE